MIGKVVIARIDISKERETERERRKMLRSKGLEQPGCLSR